MNLDSYPQQQDAPKGAAFCASSLNALQSGHARYSANPFSGEFGPAILTAFAHNGQAGSMSTKSTLVHHQSDGDEPSWHLYEEVFETGFVYLELRGVNVELHTRERGGADVVMRLPIETARQLGLHANVPPERWESACDGDKLAPLERLRGSVHRFEDPTDPV